MDIQKFNPSTPTHPPQHEQHTCMHAHTRAQGGSLSSLSWFREIDIQQCQINYYDWVLIVNNLHEDVTFLWLSVDYLPVNVSI